MAHEPVLLNEAIKFLQPDKGSAFIDATIDGGGHARKILSEMSPKAVLAGIDRDANMISRLQKEFRDNPRLKLALGNFRDLKKLTKKFSDSYDGILFDLGLSSLQLELSGRGFSFLKDEPLLMTYEAKPKVNELTAALIINSWSEKEIAQIFWQYGEERFSRRIAKAIIQARKHSKILTTGQLVRIIEKLIPRGRGRQKIHPATKTFQALRIAVNDEIEALREGLSQAWEILKPGGRIVVISFHSLEDRVVKNFFKEKKDGAEILTKKPVTPDEAERTLNPRSRSAKLRAARKIKK